jgi:hypothetical protein
MNTINFILQVTRIIIFIVSLGFIFDRSKKFFQKGERQTLIKYITSMVVWLFVLMFTIRMPFNQNIEIGIMIIFYMLIINFVLVFKLLNMIERIENKITQIVKQIALIEFKRDEKHTKK